MRTWRCSRTGAAILAATAVALVGTRTALGNFAVTANAGTLSIQTATLDAPTGVTATLGTCVKQTPSSLVVNWTASTSPATSGYEIFRSTTSGGPYTSVGTVTGQTTTSFPDGTVTFNTTYYYVVESSRATWRSANSTETSATTPKKNCN